MLKVLWMPLALLGLMTFSGCTNKCDPVKEVEYVDREVTVNVPVKCIVKDANCTLGGRGSEILINAYTCISSMKQEAKACQ